MRSIRAKTTLLTVCAIVIAMTIATVLGVIAIRDLGSQSAEEQLRLLCQTGEKNLDAYFKSVEQSVEMVSSYVEADLDGLDDEHFAAHMARAQVIFDRAAYQTSGVLTYYYRIDPAVSDTVKGFWYTNLDGSAR